MVSAQLPGDGSLGVDVVRDYLLTLLDVQTFGGSSCRKYRSYEQGPTHRCGEQVRLHCFSS
jgi:hypothetical protein